MRTKFLAIGALIVIAGTFAWHAREGSAAALHEKSGVTVSGINDRGQVVGTLTRGRVSHGFVWAKGSPNFTGLAEADAINDRGEILGTNADAQNVLWAKGRAKRIGLDYAFALNDRGQVLGCSLSDPNRCPVALWTDGKTSLLPFDSLRAAMNDQGQVVGMLPDGDAGEWQGGKVTDLGPGDPIAINDRGEILGTGPNGDVTVAERDPHRHRPRLPRCAQRAWPGDRDSRDHGAHCSCIPLEQRHDDRPRPWILDSDRNLEEWTGRRVHVCARLARARGPTRVRLAERHHDSPTGAEGACGTAQPTLAE